MGSGILFIVSTPIGNPDDITARASNVIQHCDILVCEELKPAKKLISHLGITSKELLLLNEHTTKEATGEAIVLLQAGKKLVLISDDGTPLIADPGSELVKECIDRHIAIVPIPGPSSILAAIVASGFSLLSFTFCGFLPRDKALRKNVAREYRTRHETLIFLEAPYRLNQLLDDLADGLGNDREAIVAMNLTMPSEKFERGRLSELQKYFREHPFKGEFVVVTKGAGVPFLPHPKKRR